MGRVVTVSSSGSSATVQNQRSRLSLSHLPFLFLSSFCAVCQVLSVLSFTVKASPVFNDRSHKAQSEEISDTSNKHTLRERERGQVRVSVLLLVFFWILTQILSVCPLLCSSHDSACRRNSRRQERGGSAQGLEVEEREGALKVAELKERGRDGGRERWREEWQW